MTTLRSTILAAAVLSFSAAGAAFAQQPATPPGSPPTAAPAPPSNASMTTRPSPDARPDQTNQIVRAGELESGANSFTEGQAQSRFEDAGFTSVTGLVKDDAGFWRGRGMRGGQTVDLALDFRGRIAAGPDVAALPREAPADTRLRTTPAPAPATTTPR